MAAKNVSTRVQDCVYIRNTIANRANCTMTSTLTNASEYWVELGLGGTGILKQAVIGMAPANTYAAMNQARSFETRFQCEGDNIHIDTVVANCYGAFAPTPNEVKVLDLTKALNTELPCDLTDYVNAIPHGVQFTNATLYAKLQEMYPGYNTFWVNEYAGNINFTVPNPATYAGLTNYVYFSGHIDDDMCTNAPGVSNFENFPENVVYDGDDIDGNPEILQGSNWPSASVFAAWVLINETIPEYKVQVDMYLDGTDSPNIDIVWTCYKNGQEIDPSVDEYLDASRLLIRCFAASDDTYDIEQLYDYVDEETGLRVMANARSDNKCVDLNRSLTNTDFIHTMFNAMADEIGKTYSTVDQYLIYGATGKPTYLIWLFQIEETPNPNGIQFSEMFRLREPRKWESLYPDHTLTEFSDAKTQYSRVDLEVVLHTGSNNEGREDDDDDDGDDDDTIYPTPVPPDPTPWDDEEGHGFPGNAVLTKTYSMSEAITANVGSKLWSQSYFDVLKIQSNPIENIVSVKWFPFNLNSGTTTDIKVGDVSFGINGLLISSIKVINIGSVRYDGKYGNFLDTSPYTTLKLHLPYVGIVQLDAGDFRGTTISVQYIIDLVTGECMARVKRDGIPYEDYTGRIGVDIPLTSSDRVQTEMKAMQSGIHTGAAMAGNLLAGDVTGAVAGAATGALSIAGMDYTTQRSGAPSSACGSYQNHMVWLEVMTPQYYLSSGFASIIGRPVNKFLTLRGNFNDGDFVQVDKRSKLSICMTGDENAELEQLLTSGVFI